MSVRCFTLLLSLCLSFQKAWTESLNVNSGLQYNLKDPDSVTVVCQYEWQEGWEVSVRLKGNNKIVCETSLPRRCEWYQEGNQTKFHLKNVTSDQKNLIYQCDVFRVEPIPVLKGYGNLFQLFPESHILPNISCTNVDSYTLIPPPEIPVHHNTLIWAWALIGLMLLLCLYSLIITTLYIKLKIAWTQELNDTLTYVPMQKQVRQKNADKNAEYMDMRKVPPQAVPIRDMNHNSHLPTVFVM